MICAPATLLEAAAAIHGEAYRERVLAHADKRGDEICIDEKKLARIRSQFRLDTTPAHTLPQRLRSLAAALLRWLRNGCPLTPEHLYRRRAAICSACPQWRPSGGFSAPLNHCALCGCATSLKLRLPTERCPDHPPRW